MLTVKFKEKDNFRTMVRVEKRVEKAADEGSFATAEAIVADIKSHWSGTSPSAKGAAPAIQDGILNDSIVVDRQSRDPMGKFASLLTGAAYIHFDTSDLDPGGYNYAMALEDPDYLDRPFISSALLRARGYYASNIKRFLRK